MSACRLCGWGNVFMDSDHIINITNLLQDLTIIRYSKNGFDESLFTVATGDRYRRMGKWKIGFQ